MDPVKDEMLANFVVDSHFRSLPRGANLDEQSAANSQENPIARPVDPEVFPFLTLRTNSMTSFRFSVTWVDSFTQRFRLPFLSGSTC